MITGAFSCDKVFVKTFSFLTRWLRNFEKNTRYHSAIVRNIPISLKGKYILLNKCLKGGSFYLIVIYIWNSKTISQLNFERRLVTDFYSNDFSEISLAYLLEQLKPIPEISVKNIGKILK